MASSVSPTDEGGPKGTRGPAAPPSRSSSSSTLDPVLRNTLRYTISAREYETLHKYILSRSRLVRRAVPSVAKVEKLVERPAGRDDYNAAAVRDSLRVFLVSGAALKMGSAVMDRLSGGTGKSAKKISLWNTPNFRLSLSLSSILLLHRILFRFVTRLRAHLLTPDAAPFRARNKRTTRTLTSSLAPAIGASLAGYALAIYPSEQLRITLTIYALSRAAEFGYNLAESEGWIWGKEGSKWARPWWFGSWLTFPLTMGQLIHAYVFDRDCFPGGYGKLLERNSGQYIQPRPSDYPANLPWPTWDQIVDSLGQMALLKYPPFVSPTLFPSSTTLPASLSQIAPITAPAHPLITSLTCATLHPTDVSCLRAYLTYWITMFPKVARSFTILFGLFALPKYKKFFAAPGKSLNALAASILKYTTFVTGSIGTSWAAICLFQSLLPRTTLATQRFALGGALGGLWSFVIRRDSRAEFLMTARASTESLWKVGKKRGWWTGVKGGDVFLFTASLMVINAVYERDAAAVTSGLLRKTLGSLRGEGFRDVVAEAEKRDAEKKLE